MAKSTATKAAKITAPATIPTATPKKADKATVANAFNIIKKRKKGEFLFSFEAEWGHKLNQIYAVLADMPMDLGNGAKEYRLVIHDLTILKGIEKVFLELLRKFDPRLWHRVTKLTHAIDVSFQKGKMRHLSQPVEVVGKVEIRDGKVKCSLLGIMNGGGRIGTICELIKACREAILKKNGLKMAVFENYPKSLLHDMAKSFNSNDPIKGKSIRHFDGKHNMYKAWWPDLFKDGIDGVFKVTDNQDSEHIMDIDDISMLLHKGHPFLRAALGEDLKKTGKLPAMIRNSKIAPLSQDREPALSHFEDHNGWYGKQYPKSTGLTIGLLLDYANFYLSEFIDDKYASNDKNKQMTIHSKTSRRRQLFFAGIESDTYTKQRGYFYVIVLSLMLLGLERKKGQLVWNSDISSDPKKYMRILINDVGHDVVKIIRKVGARNFNKDGEGWQSVFDVIKKRGI